MLHPQEVAIIGEAVVKGPLPQGSLAVLKTAANRPLRLGAVYVPHGKIMDQWTPGVGTGFSFTPILKPLEPIRDRLVVVSGLFRGGENDHAVSVAAWLSGAVAKRTEAENVHLGTTIDQIVAKRIGQETPFPSLELATEDFTGCRGRRRALAAVDSASTQACAHFDLGRMLLDKGADPNVADASVDVNAFNDNGDTALHGATGEALIRVLVEKGARPDVQNRLKQTPLDVVKRTRGDRSPAAILLRQLTSNASTATAPVQ